MRILTQNIFGLSFAPNCNERLNAFSQASVLKEYDVICLQEAFGDHHWEILVKIGKSVGLVYSFRFCSSSFVTNGIGILSRYPILQSDMMQYLAGGLPERLHGDYYANKGLAYVQLAIPVSALAAREATYDSAGSTASVSLGNNAIATGAAFADYTGPNQLAGRDENVNGAASQSGEPYCRVNIYTTHTVAPYEPVSIVGHDNELNSGYRTSQFIQIAEFIEKTAAIGSWPVGSEEDPASIAGYCSGRADHIILCGDLNVQGHKSPEMKALRAHFARARPNHPPLISVFEKDNFTFSRENVLNASIGKSTEDLPVQLDHILYSSSALVPVKSEVVNTSNDRVTVNGKDGGKKNLPFSDHWGVASTFVLVGATNPEREANVSLLEAKNLKPKVKPSPEADGYDADILSFTSNFLRMRAKRMMGKERTVLLILAATCFLVIPNLLQTYSPFTINGWPYRLLWFPLQAISCVLGAFFAAAGILQRPNNAALFKHQAARVDKLKKEGFC